MLALYRNLPGKRVVMTSIVPLLLVISFFGTSLPVSAVARQTPQGTTLYSVNWSGYVAHAKAAGYEQVSAQWNVPCIAPGSPEGVSSVWIGLGGWHNKNLVQVGTAQIKLPGAQGTPQITYYAWEENLASKTPNAIPLFNVHCGDRIAASVYIGGRMVLDDVTTGQASNASYGPSANAGTAEFIVERFLNQGVLGSLADFQQATFENAQVTSSQFGLAPLDNSANRVLMTATSFAGAQVLTTVGPVLPQSNSAGSFTVTWNNSGAA